MAAAGARPRPRSIAIPMSASPGIADQSTRLGRASQACVCQYPRYFATSLPHHAPAAKAIAIPQTKARVREPPASHIETARPEAIARAETSISRGLILSGESIRRARWPDWSQIGLGSAREWPDRWQGARSGTSDSALAGKSVRLASDALDTPIVSQILADRARKPGIQAVSRRPRFELQNLQIGAGRGAGLCVGSQRGPARC